MVEFRRPPWTRTQAGVCTAQWATGTCLIGFLGFALIASGNPVFAILCGILWIIYGTPTAIIGFGIGHVFRLKPAQARATGLALGLAATLVFWRVPLIELVIR